MESRSSNTTCAQSVDRSAVIGAMADRLRAAQASRQACAPIRNDAPELDAAGAYAIQAANIEARVAQGRRVVGRKIGLTSEAVQRQLGVHEPDFGTLMSDMEITSGGEVAARRLIQPRVEAEIAFVLERDLVHPDSTLAEVTRSVDFAVPAIEIVDSRIRDWDIGLVDTVADNGSAGLYVVGGSPRPLHRLDLDLGGMVMMRGGGIVSTGIGRACLGNPLNALRWLARKMAEIGAPLRAGDLILSGALGPMVAARAGDRFEATIAKLGSVHISFAEESGA